MAIDYCSPDDVKAYGALNQKADGDLFTGKDDALITQMINAYSRAIEAPNICGWSFYEETVTNKVITGGYMGSRIVIDNTGRMIIKTRKPTIQSVTSIGYKMQASATTYTPIDLTRVFYETLDPDTPPTTESHIIGVDFDYTGFRNQRFWLQLSYVGGYTEIPAPVQEAVRQLVWQQYKVREAIPTEHVALYGDSAAIVKPAKWPDNVKSLLLGYVSPIYGNPKF